MISATPWAACLRDSVLSSPIQPATYLGVASTHYSCSVAFRAAPLSTFARRQDRDYARRDLQGSTWFRRFTLSVCRSLSRMEGSLEEFRIRSDTEVVLAEHASLPVQRVQLSHSEQGKMRG